MSLQNSFLASAPQKIYHLFNLCLQQEVLTLCLTDISLSHLYQKIIFNLSTRIQNLLSRIGTLFEIQYDSQAFKYAAEKASQISFVFLVKENETIYSLYDILLLLSSINNIKYILGLSKCTFKAITFGKIANICVFFILSNSFYKKIKNLSGNLGFEIIY